jgi:hypothetical protein
MRRRLFLVAENQNFLPPPTCNVAVTVDHLDGIAAGTAVGI